MKLTLGLSWRGETDPTNELEVGGTQTFLCKLGEVTANLHQIRTYEIQPLAHVRKTRSNTWQKQSTKKVYFWYFPRYSYMAGSFKTPEAHEWSHNMSLGLIHASHGLYMISFTTLASEARTWSHIWSARFIKRCAGQGGEWRQKPGPGRLRKDDAHWQGHSLAILLALSIPHFRHHPLHLLRGFNKANLPGRSLVIFLDVLLIFAEHPL